MTMSRHPKRAGPEKPNLRAAKDLSKMRELGTSTAAHIAKTPKTFTHPQADRYTMSRDRTPMKCNAVCERTLLCRRETSTGRALSLYVAERKKSRTRKPLIDDHMSARTMYT